MWTSNILRFAWKRPWLFSRALPWASDEAVLDFVQRAHFSWFQRNQDPQTGLVFDRDRKGAPASIAATGFALTAYPVACERGWIKRSEAALYASKTINALLRAPQGPEKSGTSGHLGMFYHFLNPRTATRATAPEFWDSELSTIDTMLLMAGVLFVKNYFGGPSPEERSIRLSADALYKRVEWDKFVREDHLIYSAWTPEAGMWTNVYRGYSEALLLYILALSSPTHPVPAQCWQAFIGDAQATTKLGETYIGMPGMPLFCYQYPHCWVDFRGIKDGANQRLGFDYFENARRVTRVQHRYAVENPNGLKDYSALDWGLTASDGPGDFTKVVNGKEISFRSYSEHGGPDCFDDGTIAPTAALSSIAYCPELVMPTIRHWLSNRRELFHPDLGFTDAFNPTVEADKPSGWVDPYRIGIDQGPIVLMIENYRSQLLWRLMRSDPYLQAGLKRAGFAGGWLDAPR